MPRTKKTVKTEEVTKEQAKIATPGGKYFYASGKRKCSIATVRLYKGNGVITVNNKPISEYFVLKVLIGVVKSPLKLTGMDGKYDVTANVLGGGIHSQADAIRHGIAKALVEADPLNKHTIKQAGMLTRDPRVKERKKFGLKRARRAPQFSKR